MRGGWAESPWVGNTGADRQAAGTHVVGDTREDPLSARERGREAQGLLSPERAAASSSKGCRQPRPAVRLVGSVSPGHLLPREGAVPHPAGDGHGCGRPGQHPGLCQHRPRPRAPAHPLLSQHPHLLSYPEPARPAAALTVPPLAPLAPHVALSSPHAHGRRTVGFFSGQPSSQSRAGSLGPRPHFLPHGEALQPLGGGQAPANPTSRSLLADRQADKLQQSP